MCLSKNKNKDLRSRLNLNSILKKVSDSQNQNYYDIYYYINIDKSFEKM